MKGQPLLLVNVWDSGSAQTIQSTGAKAIATGSWSVAAAHGEQDGEALPFQLVLANLSRITKSVDLPVTINIEGGYGRFVSEVKQNVLQIIEQTPNEPSLRHLATLGVARISYGPYSLSASYGEPESTWATYFNRSVGIILMRCVHTTPSCTDRR